MQIMSISITEENREETNLENHDKVVQFLASMPKELMLEFIMAL